MLFGAKFCPELNQKKEKNLLKNCENTKIWYPSFQFYKHAENNTNLSSMKITYGTTAKIHLAILKTRFHDEKKREKKNQ